MISYATISNALDTNYGIIDFALLVCLVSLLCFTSRSWRRAAPAQEAKGTIMMLTGAGGAIPEVRNWCICQEDHPLSQGIECSTVQLPKHFNCHICFDGHVRTQSEQGSGRDRELEMTGARG